MNVRLGHSFAFFCAAAAGFRTEATVFHMGMFLTFFCTPGAIFGAYAANIAGMLASKRHDAGGAEAYFGTFSFQLYTTGQHLYVLFFQTFGSAVVALGGTF